ncbi:MULTISPECIES: hypothetical protein [unclassified Thioalkalivibrio]|uniref:hypothetical protein n=1 Tax=unclassified Thioalkalivibrio TaxID=2621013 RepID=UPI0012DEC23E|nr:MULTISPECIES: hypothetical protein [unclassified Thioalkalivibrio]
MTENSTIRFYNVAKCGYFAHGGHDPEFGDLHDVLSQLHQWVMPQPLGATCTFALDDSDDGQPTYCFDLHHERTTGDFLLVTWNEVPSVDGTMPSVNAQQRVGRADVEFTDLPDHGIPGFATYFWFIPELSVYATVRFTTAQRHNGRANLARYITEFMAKFASYAVLEEDASGDSHELRGYAEHDGEAPRNLRPRFESNPVRKGGEIEYIRNQHGDIRKLIKKNALQPHINDDWSLFTSILGSIGLAEPHQLVDEHHVRYEVSFRPSLGELDQIIDTWQAENADRKWTDVGVVMRNETQPRWLGHSLARDQFELDVKRQNDEVVDPESLLTVLTRRRREFLGLLS